MAGGDQADVLLVPRGPHADRAGHAHRQLELLVGLVAAGRPVHDHRELAPPGVLELADEQLAGLGRAAPVHVPPVVAGHVVAQRVEREVAHGQVAGGLPLQIPLQSGAERLQRDDLRVHEQLHRRLRHGFPAQQPERVGAHRARRADSDDGAPVSRHQEELVVARAGGKRGELEGRPADADGNLHAERAQPRPGLVDRDDPARRGHADADPRLVELDADVKRRSADHEADRDQQRDQAARGDEEQLLPAEPDAEQPGGHGDDEHPPPRRGSDLPGGTDRAQRRSQARGAAPMAARGRVKT